MGLHAGQQRLWGGCVCEWDPGKESSCQASHATHGAPFPVPDPGTPLSLLLPALLGPHRKGQGDRECQGGRGVGCEGRRSGIGVSPRVMRVLGVS